MITQNCKRKSLIFHLVIDKKYASLSSLSILSFAKVKLLMPALYTSSHFRFSFFSLIQNGNFLTKQHFFRSFFLAHQPFVSVYTRRPCSWWEILLACLYIYCIKSQYLMNCVDKYQTSCTFSYYIVLLFLFFFHMNVNFIIRDNYFFLSSQKEKKVLITF